MKKIPMMEARTVVLLFAFALGLGLAFHPFFFVVAAAVLLFPVWRWTSREARALLIDFHRKYKPAH